MSNPAYVQIHMVRFSMSEKEKIDRVTHIVPVIKRKWTSMRTTLATFHTTMNQLINEQEGSIKELFSL